MAVSEAIYGNTTSFVSSSAYYGFVPQNNQCYQQPRVNCASWDAQNIKLQQMSNGNWCHNGAMETDDDTRDVAIVNNYCVIPEALRGANPAGHYYLGANPVSGFAATDPHPSRQDAVRRRNRKRNNAGDLMPLDPDQFKRLRKDSGNRCTYHGTGYSKDSRLAKMCYKSARLCLGSANNCGQVESAVIESCCWAAGNHSSLLNDEHKRNSLSNNNSKLSENDAEFERMLLETHGCSAYHHQLFQSHNEITETEF